MTHLFETVPPVQPVPATEEIPSTSPALPATLETIQQLDAHWLRHFQSRLVLQPALTRTVVSFQANKSRPIYRWYKYKEAFSAALVEYLLHQYRLTAGRLLDPFAGSGTALFVAVENGLDADGLELLPIGQALIAARQCLEQEFTAEDFATLHRWATARPWEATLERVSLPVLRITQGAYPESTVAAIEHYLAACHAENARVQQVLHFTLLAVLESISYTRKDGQYLRWDYRSGRRQGKKPFHKGAIPTFSEALVGKLNEILTDLQPTAQLSFLTPTTVRGRLQLYSGSCLDLLPTLPDQTYDVILTSPPYCNRYDYTRTYALELAMLGVEEKGLLQLRQQLLSSTVENRPKDLLQLNPAWAVALAAADHQDLLQAILNYLEEQKSQGLLNNVGIPRMVRGYFYELACVIAECARLLKSGAPLFMVNDNVRYAGASVSVDLILSALAEELGFEVEQILVLPDEKGNSSQQMGEHGREPLRKCVYVWRKI